MKITKSELKAIIKEEALKFKKAIELKKELAEIEKQLNEVKAGEVMGKDGVHAGQRKPVFASKGNPNLKMEDGIEGDDDAISADVDGAEVGADVAADVAADVVADAPVGDSITISKEEVVNAIANMAKSGLNLGDAGAEPAGAEVGGVESVADEVPGDEGDEELEFDTDEEMAEVKTEAKPAEEGVKMEEKVEETTVKENLDEPIEGKSVAQAAKDSPVDDGMKKDTHVKEGAEVAEEKETIAEAEKKRMAFLAGILKG